ncbi:hypothetical protein ABL78_7498 [Leptomonas seymouri]|uniref:Uncharacterized protein n=1 Tax=Leptomonas seymouri TaxID=5684 RepID=A0A0N1HZG7_LEPSE|nr:hypothetical protein ABL78_7498 [Leptomonas seymouri]|eukprot:KPI83463.1 hypothetical protein ABL78_7498 [Leptomonas seymouri]
MRFPHFYRLPSFSSIPSIEPHHSAAEFKRPENCSTNPLRPRLRTYRTPHARAHPHSTRTIVLMTSSTTSQPPTSKVDYCLQRARAAKAAGNAALQADNPRGASFEYKKVYLLLAEYLPDEVTGPSTHASSSCGGESADSSNNGLVQMLQHRRPAASTSASPSLSASSPHITAAQLAEALQLYVTSLNNLALVHLKLGRYRQGITCVTAILESPKLRAALDGTHAKAGPFNNATRPTSDTPAGKALLRRATCYVKSGEWAAAEADVTTLMHAHAEAQTAPDPACVQLTEAIRHGRKAEAEVEKKMMQRMFA